MSGSATFTLQTNLGHHFKNARLLLQAITHKSFDVHQSNERLEFLGDAIVNYTVGAMLYRRFPALSEGELSRMRAGLVCHDGLVLIAARLGLHALLRVGADYQAGRGSQSILSDAVEALFAAVELDAGHDVAKAVIEKHMLALLESGMVELKKDSKTALQEFLQARQISVPTYELLQKGNGASAVVSASCSIPALGIKTIGTGASRKEAEKSAAKQAFERCPR